jgi:hypothetical protein
MTSARPAPPSSIPSTLAAAVASISAVIALLPTGRESTERPTVAVISSTSRKKLEAKSAPMTMVRARLHRRPQDAHQPTAVIRFVPGLLQTEDYAGFFAKPARRWLGAALAPYRLRRWMTSGSDPAFSGSA